jgi:hypothetical protein
MAAGVFVLETGSKAEQGNFRNKSISGQESH